MTPVMYDALTVGACLGKPGAGALFDPRAIASDRSIDLFRRRIITFLKELPDSDELTVEELLAELEAPL